MTVNAMREGSSSTRLDTWKAIAQHLGRSGRTVQRWHDAYGLPVHHLAGTAGSVYAYTDELDAWLRNRGRKDSNESTSPLNQMTIQIESMQRLSVVDDSPVHDPQVSPEAKLRSSGLVAFADNMWSFANCRNLNMLTRHYRAAVDLDPWNASAFACLSLVFISQGTWGNLYPPSAYRAAQAAADFALSLNGRMELARCANAWLDVLLERRWDAARDTFNQISQSSPRSGFNLNGKGLLLAAAGEFDEACRHFEEAAQLAPLHAAAPAFYCWSKYLARKCKAALHRIDELRNIGHLGPLLDGVQALAALHDLDDSSRMEEIEALAAESPHHDVLHGALGYVYALQGQANRAHEILDRLTVRQNEGMHPEPYAIALVLIGLNEPEQALGHLEQSYRNGSLWSLGFRFDPILEPLWQDPFCGEALAKCSPPIFTTHDQQSNPAR